MPKDYALLFDDSVYAEMAKDDYRSPRWMGMPSVLTKATQNPRSKKKMEELCKKNAIKQGDTWTMRKTGKNRTVVTFSATIESFDPTWCPIMRTIDGGDGNPWICRSPSEFDKAMRRTHSNLKTSSHHMWDSINVTRDNQELGSLGLLRQCLELWECEMEKWGCNGLGEKLDDKLVEHSVVRKAQIRTRCPNSPWASPSAFVARQRPKQGDRRTYHSDIGAASTWESSNVSSPSREVPLIIEEGPAPLRSRTASESSSLSSQRRKLLGLPAVRVTPDPGSEQPPSKARSGFKWKREFSGRWLEIRIGRKEQSAEHSVQASGEATPVPLSQRSTNPLPLSQASTSSNLDKRDRSSNTASDQRLLPKSHDSFQHATLTPKEGLYCRTKRALGLKHGPIDPNDPESLERTSTDRLLDRVSSTLRFLPDRRTASPSSATSVSNLSIAAPRWQRIMNRHGKIGLSTSSSIREILMGKPPIHTPEPEAMYTGSDSNQYVAVDLTEEGMTFLPSEARRIHTPPLPTDATSPGVGKARGFFFDYNAPPGPNFPDQPADANMPVGGPRRDSDWYRVKTNAIEAEAMTREQLAASVPEHLPNSPLCPRHPKHMSGGTGECPYHGRNPSLPKGMDTSSPPTSPSERWW